MLTAIKPRWIPGDQLSSFKPVPRGPPLTKKSHLLTWCRYETFRDYKTCPFGTKGSDEALTFVKNDFISNTLLFFNFFSVNCWLVTSDWSRWLVRHAYLTLIPVRPSNISTSRLTFSVDERSFEITQSAWAGEKGVFLLIWSYNITVKVFNAWLDYFSVWHNTPDIMCLCVKESDWKIYDSRREGGGLWGLGWWISSVDDNVDGLAVLKAHDK